MTTVARSTTEICEMDARTLAAQVASKQLSPVEVIKAVLERMDKLEPVLHAFCTPTPDAALERARQLEAAIMSGEEVGPLAGVPFGMKDLIVTKGVRTASGSVIYKDFIPDEDDVVVERLLGAGGIMLGKTNVPEFGYSGVAHNPVFETTRDPWNPALTTGGSSGGSGAAVATGWAQSPRAAMAAAPFASRPPTVDFTGSRHRWAASPCTRAAAMSDTRASRAGNRWSTSVR